MKIGKEETYIIDEQDIEIIALAKQGLSADDISRLLKITKEQYHLINDRLLRYTIILGTTSVLRALDIARKLSTE